MTSASSACPLAPVFHHCGKPVDLVIARKPEAFTPTAICSWERQLMPTPNVAISMRKITREAPPASPKLLSRLPRARGKNHQRAQGECVSHLDGFYLDACARSPTSDVREEQIVAPWRALVRDASQFDVIVTCFIFGDILSDETSKFPAASALRPRSTPAPTCLAQAADSAPTSPVRTKPTLLRLSAHHPAAPLAERTRKEPRFGARRRDRAALDQSRCPNIAPPSRRPLAPGPSAPCRSSESSRWPKLTNEDL
jgi:hypothetical protein